MSIKQEIDIVEKMIRLYCSKNHNTDGSLCVECSNLLEYTRKRLYKCPHKLSKPSCRKCSIKCYTPQMRKKIKAVMMYSGPRMLIFNPVITLSYLVKKLI